MPKEANLRKVLFAILLFLSSFSHASAQVLDTPQARAMLNPTIAKLTSLCMTHPEPLVREKLFDWVRTEVVQFAPSLSVQEMAVSYEMVNEKLQTIVWYNPIFILNTPQIVNVPDKEFYLWLVLYHEAVLVDEHLSGRHRLGPIVVKGPVSPSSIANSIWEAEWPAVKKEWEFAKKFGKPHLVPVIADAVGDGNNEEDFLNGFYILQVNGPGAMANPSIRESLTVRYMREVKKLQNKK